jgi:hypothetical protein
MDWRVSDETSCNRRGMRSLLIVAMLLLSSPARAVAPTDVAPPKMGGAVRLDLNRVGWCAKRSMRSRPKMTRFFEIRPDLRTVSPMREDINNHSDASDRDQLPPHFGVVGWDVEIIDGKLRIWSPGWSCETSGDGCDQGYWSIPPILEVEETVPVGACISYAASAGQTAIIGIGGEMRTYTVDDDRVMPGPRVSTPILDGVGGISYRRNAVLLQEPGGGLWLAKQAATKPTLTRVRDIDDRVIAMSSGDQDHRYLFTERSMFVVDARTMATRWKIDGEVWSATYDPDTQRHYVLAIERGARTTRAVLRLLNRAGKQIRQIVVYEGDDLIEATLKSTTIESKPDKYETLYLVYVATR